jgi:opacity protein-like surface antigen
MIKHTLLAAAAAALLASTAASANDSQFYLHGHIGQTSIEEGRFVSYRDDSDTSIGIRFGWNVSSWLSIEGGFNDFGEYESNCCGAGPFRDLDYDNFELGLRARVPFGDSSWYGMARAGLHEWDDGDPRGSNSDPYYGVGVAYQINERFAVGADFDVYTTDNALRDVDRLGVGLELSF